MRLSEEVMELLRQGRETELAERAATDARLVRPLLARLYDPSDPIRGRAARVLGHAAAAHPELGREVARRLIWALNDESATNGVYGIPALGQIGRQAPELVSVHVPALARMAWDHGLRLAILEALAEVAEPPPSSSLRSWTRSSPTWTSPSPASKRPGGISRTRSEEIETHE